MPAPRDKGERRPRKERSGNSSKARASTSKRDSSSGQGGHADRASASAAAAPAQTTTSLLTTDEVDFPRGGGTRLSAAEVREAQLEAHREADGEPEAVGAGSSKVRVFWPRAARAASVAKLVIDTLQKRRADGAATAATATAGKKKRKTTVDEAPKQLDGIRVEHLNYKVRAFTEA